MLHVGNGLWCEAFSAAGGSAVGDECKNKELKWIFAICVDSYL